MLLLALDTTTRQGSAALHRGGRLLDCEASDPTRAYGERLPIDLMRLLERNRVSLDAVELFAVAAGPGSFTGLRIGIATMQGLALANGRPLIGVSSLDALHAEHASTERPPDTLVAAWIDAQRGEVFGSLYRGAVSMDGPIVGKPEAVLAAWREMISDSAVEFTGDGALVHRDAIARAFPTAVILPEVPRLAPAVARLAERDRALAGDPSDIRPMYVRRPDVELVRDRSARP